MNLSYLIWVPAALLVNFLSCYFAAKYNATSFIKTYMFSTMAACIPAWSIAAYFSKNLIFDSLVFDVVLVVSSPVFFYYLGQGQNFTYLNWIGVVFVTIGLILARIHT